MGDSRIEIERRGTVLVARLADGVTNPINAALVRELGALLASVRADPGTRALVLGSANPKFFSIGYDLPWLLPLSRPEAEAFFRDFNRVILALLELPKPTVAALTGHAVAGGCILASACDYRVSGDARALMGVNEIKLGVPLPWPADRLLRRLLGERWARELIERGEFYLPEDARRIGLVDTLLPSERIEDWAVDRAAALGAMPEMAFAEVKRARVEELAREIRAGLEGAEQRFNECWFSPAAQARLREALAKFQPPRKEA